MPEITRFYGIIIKLFFGEHPPPHFHAVYGEYNAVFDIETLKMIEGDLPNRAEKMVLDLNGAHNISKPCLKCGLPKISINFHH